MKNIIAILPIFLVGCFEQQQYTCVDYYKFPKYEVNFNGKIDTIVAYLEVSEQFGPDMYEFKNSKYGVGELIARYPEQNTVIKKLGYSDKTSDCRRYEEVK